MKKQGCNWQVTAVFGIFLAFFGMSLYSARSVAPYSSPSTKPIPINNDAAVQWDFVSPNEVNMPRITKAELIAEFQKSISGQQKLRSWEAEYEIAFKQPARKSRGVPEVTQISHVLLMSQGVKWRLESGRGTEGMLACCDGKVRTIIWPQQKHVQIENKQEIKGVMSEPTPADFLPALSAPAYLSTGELPNILKIIDAPNTQLLPSYVRIHGDICYVLKQTSTLQHPLFKTSEKLEVWKKANPQEFQRWHDNGIGLVFVITPRAKSGAIRNFEITSRIAFDPKQGYAIVRWAKGFKSNYPREDFGAFPIKEMIYSDFRNIAAGVCIPFQMKYCIYDFDGKIQYYKHLAMDKFAVDKSYPDDVFTYKVPPDYKIFDTARKIIYQADDTPEKIAALVAAAKSRDTFYENLRKQQAPSLEYALLLNTPAIDLANLKGKTVRIHFWSITCAPCMSEMPRLQQQYGSGPQHPDEVFISVHPYVEGDNLNQVKHTIDKLGITFPVLVDAKASTNSPCWGKTCNKYGVYSLPSERVIDKDRHLAEIGPEGYIKDPREANRFTNQPAVSPPSPNKLIQSTSP